MKFALITGASKGIGRAIAYELAGRKINLLLVARSKGLLEQLAMELKDKYSIEVDYFEADLSQHEAAEQIHTWCIINNFSVQYLVNNAGYGLSGAFEKYTLNEHLENMQVNMNALVQ